MSISSNIAMMVEVANVCVTFFCTFEQKWPLGYILLLTSCAGVFTGELPLLQQKQDQRIQQ